MKSIFKIKKLKNYEKKIEFQKNNANCKNMLYNLDT